MRRKVGRETDFAMVQVSHIEYLKGLIAGYYRSARIEIPQAGSREFGFGSPEKKIETRHMWFKTVQEMQQALCRIAPFYVSYSAAYYEFPDARPMAKKNWLGADLIFDLDAPAHSCGKFTCEKCLEDIKGQTVRLVEEFLIDDFGVEKSKISINFSGGRGYHVHVRDDRFVRLGREERREIVDYISGTGLDMESFFFKGDSQKNKVFCGPKITQGGFGGKIAREIKKRLEAGDSGVWRMFGKKHTQKNLESLRRGMENGIYSDAAHAAEMSRGIEALKSEIAVCLGSQTDVNVTLDTSKLIRLPDSIHGGSGLAARSVGLERIGEFDPMADAVAFNDGEVEIIALEAIPPIAMAGGKIGPIAQGERKTLCQAGAVYLLCKKACSLIR